MFEDRIGFTYFQKDVWLKKVTARNDRGGLKAPIVFSKTTFQNISITKLCICHLVKSKYKVSFNLYMLSNLDDLSPGLKFARFCACVRTALPDVLQDQLPLVDHVLLHGLLILQKA